MTKVARTVAALQEEQLKRAAERSLAAFVRDAWPILEPATPLLWHWPLDLMCEHLEAVTAGQTRRLLITIPPRYMKSLLASVFWPVWEWIRRPETRWVFASHGEDLAVHHSLDRRTVIQSRWYQRRWGDQVQLTDQVERNEFRNSQRGRMLATSVGGSVTGKGGTRIVADDLHTPDRAASDAQRQRAIDYFVGTLATRLDDPRHGAIVVVMQRLHAADLAATCLDRGYTHLCLPAIAEGDTPITFPRSDRIVTRNAGEPLWPAREGLDELAVRQRELGSYAFAAQYQQRPAPRDGGILKRDWWQYYDTLPPRLEFAQSWDLAVKGGPGSDYVVGLVAGRRGADIYLIDRFKAQIDFPETLAAIRRLTHHYPNARLTLVEDAANGAAAVATLRREIPGLVAVRPEGGKVERAHAVSPLLEAGNVYLPRPTGPDGRRIRGREWVEDFVDECATFPMGAHDDDVDALTQLLVRWSRPHTPPELIRRMLQAGRGPTPRPIF